jgi:hypothetical protein
MAYGEDQFFPELIIIPIIIIAIIIIIITIITVDVLTSGLDLRVSDRANKTNRMRALY